MSSSNTTSELKELIAERDRLDVLIQQANSVAQARHFKLASIGIDLRPGEHFAGLVLDEHGDVKHPLVLMPEKPDGRLNWDAAMAWAHDLGGDLPTRQELALLYANCKPHMDPKLHWSNETHEENASYAWYCYFDYGYQFSGHKSYEGCVRAVRRIR